MSGFTLIELLLVISIIGVLSTMIFSSIHEARTKARIVQTANQLKAIERGLFAATLEENRNTYWTNTELGSPGAVSLSLSQLLAREYPNPGWAIKNYLSQNHTKYFDGSDVHYRNVGTIVPSCTNNAEGVTLRIPMTVFEPLSEEWIALNDIIDGPEANKTCGKFILRPGQPPSATIHVYRLSRNPGVIEF